MLKILTKTTSKKFYNKWLYKVTVYCPGIHVLRFADTLDAVINHMNAVKKDPVWWYRRDVRANRYQILTLLNLLNNYPKEWGKRIESSYVDIYTNNLNLYDELSKVMVNDIIHRYEPDTAELDLLDDRYTIVSKKLPHDRYQLRVYLQPHKIKDHDEKLLFLDWLEGQKPRVTLSKSVRDWFLYNYINWDRRYILVEDDATLLMIKLRQANVVGKVYRYVVPDK